MHAFLAFWLEKKMQSCIEGSDGANEQLIDGTTTSKTPLYGWPFMVAHSPRGGSRSCAKCTKDASPQVRVSFHNNVTNV